MGLDQQEPFSTHLPLECRNKTGVYHWLERWIAHGSDDGGSQSQRPGPNRLQRGKRPRPVVLDIEKDDSDRYVGIHPDHKDIHPTDLEALTQKAIPLTDRFQVASLLFWNSKNE